MSSASTLPVIHLNKVKLTPSASLCLLVNTYGLSPAEAQNLEAFLSTAELQQHGGMLPSEQRRQRQITRAVLRGVLGQLTGVPAADIRIGTGAYGKPCLVDSNAIGFSVSHSGGLSLLAFARDAEIGCDIEKKYPLEDIRGMGEVALHPEERGVIEGLGVGDAEDAFFRAWVRKEAALKAVGTGLSTDPALLNVGLAGAGVRLRLDGAKDGALTAFQLFCTQPAPGYVAAVASPQPACDWAVLSL